MNNRFFTPFVCLGAILVIFFFCGVVLADEGNPDETEQTVGSRPEAESFELDAIVVTAGKRKDAVSDIPAHVTVITSEDISAYAGTGITELLAQESGITVRSLFGNDKQAVLDLRGMGDTAASNVIIMVDGLVLNSPDQSGASLSSVPLEQIERIEIVRGAGSVVYGSGAVGGVINIITKKSDGSPSAQIYGSYGTYDTFENRVSLDAGIKEVAVNLNAGWHDSDGYRDNGFFRKKDVSAATGYLLADRVSVTVFGSFYEDDYGLPGPVGRADISDSGRRRQTDYPEDEGETTEAKARLELDMDLEKWGSISLKRGFLFRENDYILGYSPQISRSSQKDKIDEDTRQLDFNYLKYYSLNGLSQMFQLGLDHYKTEYYREDRPDGPRKNSETESVGIFINNQWTLFEGLKMTAGARYNHYSGRFRTDTRKVFESGKYWINGDSEKSEWDNQAYALGMTYSISSMTSFFITYATSFRVPNVDEFAESEDNLKPQEGNHAEMGARHWFGDFLSCTVALFDIRIDDEIYYSDINRNYNDTTIRQGIETDISLYPLEDLRLWANYTYTKAEFDMQNTAIPLVAEHSGAAGMHWQMIEDFSLSLSGTCTGSRYDGNDLQNNRYRKLDDYFVCDGKLTWKRRNLRIFAGVHNMFNELYETSGYSEQYYPMPERTIYGGLRWNY